MSQFLESSNPERSPIHNIPYDVLLEIFVRCLPQHPFDWRNKQPNAKLAPMLLCHICSAWRTVAFSSPVLWTHLGCHFTVYWIRLDATYWAIRPRALEFVLWWSTKHGTIPPFLSFQADADQDQDNDILEARIEDATESKRAVAIRLVADQVLLLRYMSSAQHLNLGLSFWNMILRVVERRASIEFPNLHTVTGDWRRCKPRSALHPDGTILGLLPNFALQLLRRLDIRNIIFSNDTVILPHLSKLTHLSLQKVSCTLRSWHLLIRAFPNLQ
ncbi:hypothetical protein BDN70DRAFT_616898 [Pholiota conissans]|uniref:F-box domain-containing protein n=1 Tax=Pholiota conissans TaxID=109636 RepID=A0A9P5Z3E8_9AGAR|nr:hypothetical protein BDN70DRAFT_616898 [Pholiota conissans]